MLVITRGYQPSFPMIFHQTWRIFPWLSPRRMLEESTWALDPHPSAPAASIQALGYDLPWHLVALFCRVHSLPRSLTLRPDLVLIFGEKTPGDRNGDNKQEYLQNS